MSILQLKATKPDRPFAPDWLKPALVDFDPQGKRRAKIWEMSLALHCSIIGTCLSAAQLRQVFVRLGDSDARTASDHVLHGRGVGAARYHDAAGRLLHKTLDKLHETAIKRFSKAASLEALKRLWNDALDQGEIPGAYWAVLSHPLSDRAFVQEVFGEIHMLSHLVGSSNRLDLARLRRLEIDLGDREETILRQQIRVQESADERSELRRRIGDLEAAAARAVASAEAATTSIDDASTLRQKLETEKVRATDLLARLERAETQLQDSQRMIADLQAREQLVDLELRALEGELANAGAGSVEQPPVDIGGRTLVYVGGRPGLVDQLRALVRQRGGSLLCHDGGIDDNLALIAGTLGRADAAFFPVDCISHRAVGQIKKHCIDAGKPFIPLRSASVASFLAALQANATVIGCLPDLPATPRF